MSAVLGHKKEDRHNRTHKDTRQSAGKETGNAQTPTSDSELGIGDVRTTDHTVVALIFDLALLNLQIMAVTHAADLILVTVVQFLCALVPAQSDLWVVYLDLTLEHGRLVLCNRLVTNVLHHRDGLWTKDVI